MSETLEFGRVVTITPDDEVTDSIKAILDYDYVATRVDNWLNGIETGPMSVVTAKAKDDGYAVGWHAEGFDTGKGDRLARLHLEAYARGV